MASNEAPRRYITTITVSMFANSQADAELLSGLVRDHLAAELGGGQSIVTVRDVRPDTTFGSDVPEVWVVVMEGEDTVYGPFASEDECYACAASVSESPNDWTPVRLNRPET